MEIDIGTVIRSEDFERRSDCFMEGIVTGVVDGMIECTTTRIVFDNVVEEIDDGTAEFKTPLPGRLLFDWDSRIQLVVGDFLVHPAEAV